MFTLQYLGVVQCRTARQARKGLAVRVTQPLLDTTAGYPECGLRLGVALTGTMQRALRLPRSAIFNAKMFALNNAWAHLQSLCCLLQG